MAMTNYTPEQIEHKQACCDWCSLPIVSEIPIRVDNKAYHNECCRKYESFLQDYITGLSNLQKFYSNGKLSQIEFTKEIGG